MWPRGRIDCPTWPALAFNDASFLALLVGAITAKMRWEMGKERGKCVAATVIYPPFCCILIIYSPAPPVPSVADAITSNRSPIHRSQN